MYITICSQAFGHWGSPDPPLDPPGSAAGASENTGDDDDVDMLALGVEVESERELGSAAYFLGDTLVAEVLGSATFG